MSDHVQQSVLPETYGQWKVIRGKLAADEPNAKWERVVVLSADEVAPDGRLFSRDIATFHESDWAVAFAEECARALAAATGTELA